MLILSPAGKDIESAIPVTPLNYSDLDITIPPTAHATEVWMIDIDGVGANEGRTIVVYDIGCLLYTSDAADE